MYKVFLFFSIFLCFSLVSYSQSLNQICVITIKLQAPNGSDFKFPDDSLFIAGDRAIEKLIGLNDLEIDGKLTRQAESKGYNLIDFKTNKYKFLKTLESFDPGKDDFEPLSKKPSGLSFDYKFYNGEQVVVLDTSIAGENYKKVSFINESGPMKGAKVMVLLMKKTTKNYQNLFPNLEKEFGGRLSSMTLTLPENRGSHEWKVEYLPADKNPYFSFLKSLD